jgi:membrane-anchored protein YejM (alkaline phosphatase superfamily)
MKAVSLSELKKELQEIPQKELIELCVTLAKYKKDNKEFLSYLLFEAHDKDTFVNEVKAEIDEQMTMLQAQPNLYFVKKGLRKMLRIITKYNKYINDKALSADLLIYFCSKLKHSGIPYYKSRLILNMYEQQLKKINTLINSLHEDLQQDYLRDLEKLV